MLVLESRSLFELCSACFISQLCCVMLVMLVRVAIDRLGVVAELAGMQSVYCISYTFVQPINKTFTYSFVRSF